MDSLLKKLSIKGFEEKFSTEENCLKFLEQVKWGKGYTCRKCGNKNYCSGKKPFSRRCTRCKHEESVTAHTSFHRCKLNISEAFKMAYRIVQDPGISTYSLAKEFGLRQMTCWKMKTKLLDNEND